MKSTTLTMAKMNNDQITALAREYAEEYTKKKYPNAHGHVRERIVEGRLEHMEEFLPWLLRRFCLVEKEAVRKEYQEASAHVMDAIKRKNPYAESCGKGKRLVLKSLFPEIAKEVEE